MIIRGPNSGKTTLAKTLVSYLSKLSDNAKRQIPTLVNLDPHSPQFVVPGNLIATPISSLLNLENVNFGETVINGVTFYRQKQPCVVSFGFESIDSNLKLFKYGVSQLSQTLKQRMDKDVKVGDGVVVLDCPSSLGTNQELFDFVRACFGVTIVVVVGDERLSVSLKKRGLKVVNGIENINLKSEVKEEGQMEGIEKTSGSQEKEKDLQIIKINKSTGCIDKSDRFVRELQQRAIKEYFYGLDNVQLNPFTISVGFNELIILKPKVDNVNLDFLGGDFDDGSITDPSSLYTRVKTGQENLSNCILTIVDDSGVDTLKHLNDLDDYEANKELIGQVAGRGVIGSCYVLNSDESKVKLLVPLPVTKLPSKVVILTEFRYHE
ncbi:unnamed protein product [Ambrosiozyma monospora]|uniref:Unnamed protein product n=1 Tax=Ambrosiozyma monospora TaxID=43982 RepID=A0ACB5T5V5_AMBMO|nr:unnamed protein product [Ambrosiozyma monospora]